MDSIEQLDWGTYSFFDFLAKKNPELPRYLHVEWANVAGGYIAVSVIAAVALALFLCRHRRRDAICAMLAFAAGCGSIELAHWLVPRSRPEDARNAFRDIEMLGSYPCASVLLFTLAVTILGFALWEVLKPIWAKALYVVVAALLVVWVCMAQFFLSLHFLTDILGGLAGAGLFGFGAFRFFEPDRSPK